MSMKRRVQKLTEDEARRQFPLVRSLPGWFFRVDEKSPGCYLAEGTDLWRRRVSRRGGDPDALLAQCEESARQIADQVRIADTP